MSNDMSTKRQYLYAFRVMCIAFMPLVASCKTVPVQSCWDEVTHRVNGDRLSCVSYIDRMGDEIRATDEACIIWHLEPGVYHASTQAIDCDGVPSGFADPIAVKVTIP